jgi:ribosome biogenesis protein Tsr3
VERVEGLGLSLVSKHAAGRRLSAMAATDYGPVVALEVVRALTAALDVLHRAGLAHGLVSAERVV